MKKLLLGNLDRMIRRLLPYNFKQIVQPEKILENHRTFTQDLGIRGQIIVAKGGRYYINIATTCC
jgi:predicted sulfurtransferase